MTGGERRGTPTGSRAAHPADGRGVAPALIARALGGGAAGAAVATGFPSVDHLLGGGLRRGDLVVLAGDMGAGKSALALAMAVRSAAGGAATAYLSGEMTVERLYERALAIEGRVRIDDLRRGDLDDETHAAVAGAALALRTRSPLFEPLRDAGVAGVSDVLAWQLGIELAVVDPLQALAAGRLALEDEVASAARALKELAMRRSTAILAVTGLAHAVRERGDPRPRLGDLGGLGAIGQHADVVIGLFREELYGVHPDTKGAAELHVLKNRNGPTGFVDLYFYEHWLRFEDMVEPDR